MAHTAAELELAQLREAISSRDVIGQAKGILMEREHLTDDQAFDRLRTASQKRNRKLREIAEELVLTGQLELSLGD
jgi:AmiR/NasT family two-component response regulator